MNNLSKPPAPMSGRELMIGVLFAVFIFGLVLFFIVFCPVSAWLLAQGLFGG